MKKNEKEQYTIKIIFKPLPISNKKEELTLKCINTFLEEKFLRVIFYDGITLINVDSIEQIISYHN